MQGASQQRICTGRLNMIWGKENITTWRGLHIHCADLVQTQRLQGNRWRRGCLFMDGIFIVNGSCCPAEMPDSMAGKKVQI